MRNLIPVFVLVLSWPLFVLDPAKGGDDYTHFRTDETILNAHDKERSDKWQTCADAKRYYDSVAGPYQDLSKDTLRKRGLYTAVLKNASFRLDKAKDDFIKTHERWYLVEEDIREYRSNDPVGFKELSELKGDNGHRIYLYIGRKELADTPGITHWHYNEGYNQFYVAVGADTKNDAFLIWLNSTAADVGKVIAHEQGHIVDILNRPGYYKNAENGWTSLNCQAKENRYVAFVKPAKDAEDAYVERVRRIKNPYSRVKYNKKWWRDWLDTKLNQ
jgi:hypothetical protein